MESLTSVSVEGRFSSGHSKCENIQFEKLGNRFLFKGDVLTGETEEQIKESKHLLEKQFRILGDTRPAWLLFDGKRVFEYAPRRFSVTIFTASEPPRPPYVVHFDPSNWSQVVGIVPVKAVLKDLDYSEEKPGFHRFFKRFEKRGDPAERFVFTQLELKVAESKGWNVISASFEGGIAGSTRVEIEWEKVEENWYPAKGTLFKNGQQSEQWQIMKISFNPKVISSDFQFHENALPIGIRIVEGNPGTAQKERFSGGEDGERQFRLNMGISRLNATK